MTTPDRARPTGGFYRPELDGLRAVAFFVVFFSHAVQPTEEFWTAHAGARMGPWIAGFIRGGRFGVDLFFVLSAYLITEILLRERHARGTIDVKAFWWRRILRIWPLYFVYFFAAVLIGPRVMKLDTPSDGYLAAFLLFSGNWAVALGGFTQTAFNHLWSVSIEEQFYLSWPLIARRLSLRGLARFTACLIPLAFAARVYLIAAHGDGLDERVWCNTVARLDPIAIGALLALVLNGRAPALGPAAARLALAGSLVSVMALSRYDALFKSPVAGALAYTVVAAACAVSVVATLSLGTRTALSWRAPVYLGRISYGLYVFHFFFAHWVAQHVHHPAAPLLTLALTVAFSAASYRWLEQPFLRLKRRYSREGAPAPTPAAST